MKRQALALLSSICNRQTALATTVVVSTTTMALDACIVYPRLLDVKNEQLLPTCVYMSAFFTCQQIDAKIEKVLGCELLEILR